MKQQPAILIPLVFSLLSGCVVVDPDLDPCLDGSCIGVTYTGMGNLGFYWAFEQPDGSVTDSCRLAEVSSVDIRIYTAWGELEYAALRMPCSDLGAIITRFKTGDYQLELTALCPSGAITHEALYEVSVFSGENEFGSLVLDYLAPCH